MRSGALTALLVALAITVALASTAQAATTRSVCTRTAVLRDSPKGFVIARLYRHQRLQVQRRSADRRWMLVVVTVPGTVGWIPARSVCRA